MQKMEINKCSNFISMPDWPEGRFALPKFVLFLQMLWLNKVRYLLPLSSFTDNISPSIRLNCNGVRHADRICLAFIEMNLFPTAASAFCFNWTECYSAYWSQEERHFFEFRLNARIQEQLNNFVLNFKKSLRWFEKSQWIKKRLQEIPRKR